MLAAPGSVSNPIWQSLFIARYSRGEISYPANKRWGQRLPVSNLAKFQVIKRASKADITGIRCAGVTVGKVEAVQIGQTAFDFLSLAVQHRLNLHIFWAQAGFINDQQRSFQNAIDKRDPGLNRGPFRPISGQ